MKETLNYLFEHKTLNKEQARNVLTDIGTGKFSENEIASFLTVYCMRSITPQELSGFREALLDLCIKVNLQEFNTIDLCGTGGDEKNTFNISTLASFVVAGAGIKVAKHGNYGVSSGCGSSNVLEYLGYEFLNDESKLKKQIEEAGMCYLHAQLFHPAMKFVGPIRKALKVKTFFNMLGPMVNPSFVKNQIVGVFNLEVARLYNYVYNETNNNYSIIHGLDGFDEISLTDTVKVISNNGEQNYQPKDLGFEPVKLEELSGGNTVEESAKIFTNILENNATIAQKNVVIANAGMAIKTVNQNSSIEDCMLQARESLESGKALNVFKKLIK